MKIRTVIVDDEALGRERMRQLLQSEPEIQIAGECGDGCAAVEMIREVAPDLVFLDVQMPELDGFGVLAALGAEALPVVVFVTAHDQFALRAFEVHAIDYLLKPFDRERFRKALDRALTEVRNRASGGLDQRLSALLKEIKPAAKPVDRLAVKTGDRVLLIKVGELDWIKAADNYVELHRGRETHLLRETLNALEARLPAEDFVRISRSVIVNRERVRELKPLFSGEYTVTLENGTELGLSRGYREALARLGLS